MMRYNALIVIVLVLLMNTLASTGAWAQEAQTVGISPFTLSFAKEFVPVQNRDRTELNGRPEGRSLMAMLQADAEGEKVEAPVVEDSSDNWRFMIAPYAVLSSIDAKSTIGGATTSIDLSFSDLLDHFDVFAFAVRSEAWKRDWGIILDWQYTDLSGNFRASGPFNAKAEIDIKHSVVDIALARRLLTMPLGKNEDKDGAPRLVITGWGGGRYTYLKQEINIKPGPKFGGSEDWVEPLIGGRVVVALNKTLAMFARGNVSGFSVGSASKLTWDVRAGFDVRFSEHISAFFAYSIYDINYSRGSGTSKFGLDGRLHGPMAALVINW